MRVSRADKVPIAAEKLIEALVIANIHPKLSEWPNMPNDFGLFIGPRPIL
jgi:hypothetical protein